MTKKGNKVTKSIPETIDEVNLENCLKDFDVANARVIEYAKRISQLNADNIRLQDENSRLRIKSERYDSLINSNSGRVYFILVRIFKKLKALAKR